MYQDSKKILLIAGFGITALNAMAREKPNILIILLDDAGYGDFGFMGSKEFLTPNIDKLSEESLNFRRAYVTCPVSGPSRAGLLTGKYQQRFGFIYNNVPAACDKEASIDLDRCGLPLDQKTMGDYFQRTGYRTIALGKWHQGLSPDFHPNKRGFNEFFGFLGGQRSFFAIDEPEDEFMLWQNSKPIGEQKKYFTDMLGDRACEYIRDVKTDKRPFLMYLAFNAVHTPFDAKNEDLERFPLLKGSRKKLAAMTWTVDEAIKKIVMELKATGKYENTVIVFTNDNGGPSDQGMFNGQLSGCKATLLEGGIRVPFFIRFPKEYAQLNQLKPYTHAISTFDLLPSLLSIAGGNIPDDIDGVNLMPHLLDYQKIPHEKLFWYFDGDFSAIMDGDWKLIVMPDRPAELYNLKDDLAETTNLASLHPERVMQLYKELGEWKVNMARPRWQLLPKFTKNACEKYDYFKKKI